MKQQIAIQGIKGSFHHLVAENFYGKSVAVKELHSFDDLVNQLITNNCSEAIMAIENSIAGSIIPNYALIDANNLVILGEQYLSINHQLMALPNQDLNKIKEVHSHPMALLQCKAFFKPYPHIKLVEADDTAAVAKQIKEKQLKHLGAIASTRAAEIYELNILAKNIQTIENNETRFVVLGTNNAEVLTDNSSLSKASLKFDLAHKRGSLASLLNVISDCKLNLTKIQSLPKIETPWRYSFFADVTFEYFSDFEKAKRIIQIMAEDFKVLGVYKNAKL